MAPRIEALRVPEAAAALGVRPDTLRSWIRHGAPVVQPGGTGPGEGALVDLEALRRWRGRSADDAPLVAIDGDSIARGLLAAYRARLHRDLGLTDRQAAALLAESWAHTVREATGHPPSEPWPEQIATLISIAASSRPVNQP
jgi:hypothetical protein